jgi:hypothetical protein
MCNHHWRLRICHSPGGRDEISIVHKTRGALGKVTLYEPRGDAQLPANNNFETLILPGEME